MEKTQTPIKKFKTINCNFRMPDGTTCDIPCMSGKLGKCGKHYNQILEERAKKRAAQEKQKAKKEKKRIKKQETITEKKLDIIFSRLVRSIYPPFCHSSKVPLEFSKSNAAHLVTRAIRSTRWDLRNVYPTTYAENMYNQLHVIQLAKRLQTYYGIDIEQWEKVARATTCKLSSSDRKAMYDVFTNAFERVQQIRRQVNYEDSLAKLRLEVISKTKIIM